MPPSERRGVGDEQPDAPRPHLPTLEDFPERGPNSLGTIANRAMARGIDTLIVFAPFLVAMVVLVDGNGASEEVRLPWWFFALEVLAVAVYDFVFIAWRGRTPGKAALGLRVARYADGKRPTPGQAAQRALVPAAAAAVPWPFVGAWWSVVYVSALWSPLRRGWHDQAGGTLVIATR